MKPASRKWMCLCKSCCATIASAFGIELVFFHQHPCRQCLRRITRQHRNFRPRNDRPAIQFFSHIMNRAAMNLHAISQRPLMRMGPLVERQAGKGEY